MAYQHYRSPFGDTTFTKVFVGGLAWETPTNEMRQYFDQFGDILEAVIITDKNTAKSKGYGFVTFRDPESAKRACIDPNPVIDGRRANCNIASLGRPRPSPPRGRYQGGASSYQGGLPSPQGVISYSGVSGQVQLQPAAPPPPPPPLPSPIIYPPYGYPTYPHDYGYHQAHAQALYNPTIQQQQYYNQMYGTATSSSTIGSPYYYGYSMQPSPRGVGVGVGGGGGGGTYHPAPHAQRIQGPSYLYYPTQMDASFSTYPQPQPQPPLLPTLQPTTTAAPPARHHQPFPSSSSTDTLAQQHTSTETESGVVTSESPNI